MSQEAFDAHQARIKGAAKPAATAPAVTLAPTVKPQAQEPAPTSPKERLQALGRMAEGKMNGTEQAYADLLEGRKLAGEVAWWKFEAIKLRLADNTFYTPDFFVMMADGRLQVHEVKGGVWQDDSRVKIKVAASLYPFEFFGAMPKRKKDGGGWDIEAFSR